MEKTNQMKQIQFTLAIALFLIVAPVGCGDRQEAIIEPIEGNTPVSENERRSSEYLDAMTVIEPETEEGEEPEAE